MQMTNEEIYREYRLAKEPKKAIGILAQLNACDKMEIQRIIDNEEKKAKAAGEEKPKRKYTRKKAVTPETEKKPVEAESKPSVPREFISLAITRIDNLYDEIKELEDLIAKHRTEIQILNDRLTECDYTAIVR